MDWVSSKAHLPVLRKSTESAESAMSLTYMWLWQEEVNSLNLSCSHTIQILL